MNILMIGDVVGPAGCAFLRKRLPAYKREHEIDLVIANGENASQGNGMLPASARYLLDSGVNVLTSGNHVFKRYETAEFLEETPCVLRPANYPDAAAGHGVYLYDAGRVQVAVISLLGVIFMQPLASPFETIDRILDALDRRAGIILVDFHAESTGEKAALAHYLDGRVTALCGTHTHVQTADESILPNGTGFITDLGMTGPRESALGIDPACVIRRYKTGMPSRFQLSENPCMLNGVRLEADPKTGKCVKIERVNLV